MLACRRGIRYELQIGHCMDGKLLNSEGRHVANVVGTDVFDLSGKKLYDLRGANIYKTTGANS